MAESARRRTRRLWALWLAGLLSAPSLQANVPAPAHDFGTCDAGRLKGIPARSADAPSGSEFARRVQALSGESRDARIRSELMAGNLPNFLRQLVPVTLAARDSAHRLTVCVLPDYLAVGTDRDFVFVPMGLDAALTVAARFGFELPTPKIVDAIYDESVVKLRPQSLPAGDQMRSTGYFVHHNLLIGEQRAALDAPLGELTSGHKKDLVLTRRLWDVPGRVAIYGWHRNLNAPIQPLSTVHGARYADYSHGIRLVSDTVYVDGKARSIADVLADPTLAPLLTRDGVLPHLTERLSLLRARLEQPLAGR